MQWLYETKQGDCFDVLAMDIYGSEHLAYLLIMANPHLMKYTYFPAGLKMIVPQTPKSKLNSSKPAPPWI
ncbi:MAG: tail protein X [Candidatus Cloacimonetes bacterium]|nr:tail protein X [Candidatus Cloacimonadota bacterium]